MHYPRKRRWPLRLLGFLATVALLGSGAAIAYMVLPAKEEPPAAAAKPRATGKRGAKATPALTKAQRRARREAVAKLTGQGYEPVRLADWRPRAPVKVLVGRSDTDAMRAFFFAGGKFVGYDDAATSNRLRLVKAAGTSVTLAYKLSDGSTTKVRFRYADGRVTPTTPVPVSSLR